MKVAWQTSGMLYRKAGLLDIYGEPQLVPVKRIPLGVIRMIETVEKSSVRADSSGSRGKAEQDQFDAVFVTPLSSKVLQNDIIVVEGVKLRIDSIHRRFGLRGREGQLEIGAMVWV